MFSAGLDIMEMYQKSPERCAEFWRAVQEMWLKLYGSNMVVIAAINVRIKCEHKCRKITCIGDELLADLITASTGFQSRRWMSDVPHV